MSISFVRAKAISRGAGQSAVACSAYRSCSKMRDEQDNKIQDYTRKEGLIASGFVNPDGVKMDRQRLWNLVEKTENRKDARLAKEFIVAIPHELPQKMQIEIAQEIAKQLSKENRFADWAIHEPNKNGNDKNIHAHFLITERSWNKENGTFEKNKNREWNTEVYLQKQKEAIAEICNVRLREKNLPEIDPRRYIEKLEAGLDVPEPQKHLGVKVVNATRKETARLKKVEKEIKQLEDLGYGNTERTTGLNRSNDDRSNSNEKKSRADSEATNKNGNTRSRDKDDYEYDR